MVAVLAERSVELEGLGYELLQLWANWARDDREGESWGQSTGPRIPRGHHGTPPNQWFVVNRIVSRLLYEHEDYRRVAKPFFLGERPVWEIARTLKCSSDSVLTTIVRVCGLVEREYSDWKEARR